LRRSRLLAPALAIAALAAYVPPAAALSGGSTGTNFDCAPGSAQVISQFRDPKRITGMGNLQCPPPGSLAPGHFGPSNFRPAPPPPPVPGTPCHFSFETPVQMRLNGSTVQFLTWSPTTDAAGRYTSDPMDPTWQSSGWYNPADAQEFSGNIVGVYDQAGTIDWFYNWLFDGTWTVVGGRIRCVGQGLLNGWSAPCPLLKLAATDCFDPFTPPVPARSGGVPASALGLDLNAFLSGEVFGGVITSLPAQPNPGLTNIPTCFYVSGMTVNGQPANPQQDVFWERIVEGPQVEPEGRHVFFVFVIHVSYRATVWDFGDGTRVTIPQGGSSPETRPAACGDIPNQQFVVAHTYHRYSVGDGFHVTVTHQYGVDVTELWRDSAPNTHRIDFLDVIPPVDVPALPLPAYVMPVVQEEGVPIG